MQTNNASTGKPGTSNNMPQGAQTVSIGNKHMMTYIPNGEGGSNGDGNSEQHHQHPSEQHMSFNSFPKNMDMDDMNNNKSTPSMLDREESLDDDVFNASLDVFLKDDQGYDVDQLIDYGHDNLAPPLDDTNNEGGSGGRKRKASHAFLTEMSSLTNSSECTVAPHLITAAAAAAVASLQQKQEAETAALHSAAAAGTAAAAAPNNMAYSTQGSLIQLPPSLLFPPPPPAPPQQAAAVAASANPTTAIPGGMAIGSQEHQQLQQQQQNTLASNLMKSMSPLTASLFQQPGGAAAATTTTNNNISMLRAGANQAAASNAAAAAASAAAPSSNYLGGTNNPTAVAPNAFDTLFGFNSIPELPAVPPPPPNQGCAAFPPAPTKPPPAHPFPSAVQSATANSLAAAAASRQQHQQQQQHQGGYQTGAGGTTTSATSMSFTDASSHSANANKRRSSSQQQLRQMGAKPPTIKSSSTSNLLHVSEDEHDRLKRRSIRNIREQQRSNKIAERITELRNLLQGAGVHHKSDRYSTLVGVVNYVKMLQRRSKKLDEEHKVLLETISGAGEMVNGTSTFGGLPPPPPPPGTTTVQTFDVSGENSSSISSDRDNNDEEFMVFVQGIDYRFIFANCGVALAIASVDGRFVDCNDEWLRLTGYSRKELMGEGKKGGNHRSTSSTSVASTAAHAPPASVKSSSFPPSEILISRQHLSLFNLLGREDMETVYTAMSRMLRSAPPNSRTTATSSSSSSSDPNTSDSFLESMSGNEAASGVDGENFQRYTVDHWAGRVKHTRRKENSVSSCFRVGLFPCVLQEM